MPSTVTLPEELWRFAGGIQHHEVAGRTAREALHELAARHPELQDRLLDASGNLQPHLALLHNGRLLSPPSIAAAMLRDGDCIEVFPLASGG
jgi:molybdopterin converting factor small subunit